MQIPNQAVFTLNSAVTPQIQWGSVNPSSTPSNSVLTGMPVGSIYIQQIGSPTITSCIAWVKALSDIVASQNLVNPWVNFSQARAAIGTYAPSFSSDEFVAYQPGTVYVHNETKDTGVYRTAWMKVSSGGTRSDWISIAESESLQGVVASITASGLTTDIVESSTLTWRYPSVGTPVVLEAKPATAGIVQSDLRLNIPTAGLYRVDAGCSITTSAAADIRLGVAIDGTYAHHMNSVYSGVSPAMLSGSKMIRFSKNNVVGLAVAVQVASGTFTLTNMNLSIELIAP